MPAAVARTLPRSFESRQTSDYADAAELDAEVVRELRPDVVAFIAACERVVEQLIGSDTDDGS